MKNIEIIDNFLPEELSEEIYKVLSSPNFAWFYQKTTVDPIFDRIIKGSYDYPQFSHIFYNRNHGETIINSDYHPIADQVCRRYMLNENIDISLLRCKANLQLCYPKRQKNEKFNPPHVDLHDAGECLTAIYYVCDSDGDTYFFNDNYEVIHSVSPKANRFIVFDGQMLHAGNHPLDSRERIVINFVFKKLSDRISN